MGSWSLLESKANSVLSVPGVLSVAFDGAKGMAFGVDVETAEEGMITLLLEVLGKCFGCLASALCHYHDSEFRVRYISLESTIIKGSQIFLDLPIYGTQTIVGATASPSSGSLRLLAPEILSKRQRNSAASDLLGLELSWSAIWIA